jgi:phytoene dehydrogenase-like protein
LERRHIVGGAAVTEEFHPGFRTSIASYTVSLLSPDVIRDMRLTERGLCIVERPFAGFVPYSDDRYLVLGGDPEKAQAQVRKFSEKDAETLPEYENMLSEVADVLKDIANKEKMMPRDFITADGFHITEKCRRYLSPLIAGEDYPPYKNGLPSYIKLKNVAVKKKLAASFKV